ncbi:MAG: RrF2 family transcriptional regulator [Firmicutes bacterium]|nr:RrF2 family transcriptional regulator [Bacillota bacterium]MBR3748267.1 RrF2 family transcriptional regulator [Bacillota bacterium]MBR6970735.1 RrF2 family transcriptional regulator [Bacillota bacterium]
MISTRGRYALRVMIDLAEQGEETYTPLKEVAERQRISKKYIEAIMTSLSKAGLVDAVHGKGGGYRLNRKPREYTLSEILRVTERDLAPVACLEHGAAPCEYAGSCKTLPVWDKLNLMINEYLDGVTLEDLAG